MTKLCDDHCWAGEGECPKCEIAFPADWAQGGPPRTADLNANRTVVVDREYKWNPDMSACPRNAKVQLLGAGGVAHYGICKGEPFWVKWAPLPTN